MNPKLILVYDFIFSGQISKQSFNYFCEICGKMFVSVVGMWMGGEDQNQSVMCLTKYFPQLTKLPAG